MSTLGSGISRRTLLGAFAGVGAAALAGCAAPNQPQYNDAGARILTMWGGWGGDQAGQIQGQLDLFNASQSEVEFRYVPQGVLEQKLLTGIASGNVPSVVLWDRWQTAKFARRGALQSVNGWADADGFDLDQFFPEAVREMTYAGETFGLPLLVDSRAIFYNKAHLAEAGVQPPTTWAELADAAQALTIRDGDTLTRAGFELQDVGQFSSYLQQAGGQMLDPSQQYCTFDSDAGREVLEFWDDLINVRGVYQLGFSDGIDAFAQGLVSMKYDGPWQLPTWDAVDGLDYGVVPAVAGPRGDRGAGLGGFGLIVPTDAPEPEWAWELMKWWAGSVANNLTFAQVSGWIPAHMDSAADPYFTSEPRLAPIVETIQIATVRPPVPGYSDVEGLALIPALQDVMSNVLDGPQALRQATEQGDRILEANR